MSGLRTALTALCFALSSAVFASPSCADLDAAAQRAAQALLKRIDAQGRFTYREDARGQALPGYNLARHAGALYALAAHPPSLRNPALARATHWLARQQRPLADWPGTAAIWSDAEGHPRRAKLGAAGLALAAFADLRAQGAAAPPLRDLQALAAFLVQMQDDAGRFQMRYVEGIGAQRRHSLYYPGEAALGLYRLAALDGDPRWVRAADRALAVLIEDRERQQQWPPDHWALIAAAEPNAASWPAGAREALIEALLAEARPDGALTLDGRSTPTATRLEGLLAALPQRLADAARQKAEAATAPALQVLLAMQRADGTLPLGGAGRSAGEHRIDYSQHALSAFAEAARRGHCLKN